jgi:hypothetical protein
MHRYRAQSTVVRCRNGCCQRTSMTQLVSLLNGIFETHWKEKICKAKAAQSQRFNTRCSVVSVFNWGVVSGA